MENKHTCHMTSEQRLIDANAKELINRININFGGVTRNVIKSILKDAPTVDAVAVPCKMGDEVWGLKKYRSRLIPEKGVVYQMYFGDDMRLCICVKNVCRGEWGKNVFATKEEADAALAKMDGGNDNA